jgi:hypothetical protein
MPFKKGNPGRPKGSLNKTTRQVKEFLAQLVDDPEIQQATRERILAGDVTGFFKAIELVHGKARQSVDMNATVQGTMILGSDVAED